MTTPTATLVAPPPAPVRGAPRLLKGLVGAAAVALVGLALTHVGALGASWSDALTKLTHLGWQWPVLLAVVWLLGLGAHTVVLTAALPGLTHRRALTLNVAGNAVANLLPLGGMAGTALNLGMARSWGHTGQDFVRFALVSKACDLVTKLTTPVLAVAVLLASGRLAANGRTWALLGGTVLSAAAGLLVILALLGQVRPRILRRHRVGALLGGAHALVRCRWAALTVGTGGYLALQGLLLWLCLAAVGLRLPPATLFAALVATRLLSLLQITPAGAGFVEAGTIALLVALQVDPTGALAGLLLYRAFVLFAEVPAGGVAIVVWALSRRERPIRAAYPRRNGDSADGPRQRRRR